MFRTVTNIIMTCLLLLSTTGFAISEHYCGNKLVAVEFKTGIDPCCSDDSCCHTDIQFLQLDDDFLAVAPQTNMENIFASDLIITSSHVEFHLPESCFITSFNYSDPPPRSISTRLASQQVFLLWYFKRRGTKTQKKIFRFVEN